MNTNTIDPMTIVHDGYPANPNYVPNVKEEVEEWLNTSVDDEPVLICNETAREIAAYWQSERGWGLHFAIFASSGAVTGGLMAAIGQAYETVVPSVNNGLSYDEGQQAERELLALAAHIRSYTN